MNLIQFFIAVAVSIVGSIFLVGLYTFGSTGVVFDTVNIGDNARMFLSVSIFAFVLCTFVISFGFSFIRKIK
jgi:hypothetical protein